MNKVTGEDGTKVFNQDKVHCDLYEMNGKLWFSTQGGNYGGGDYGPYPGGHFFSYDLKTEKITDLGIGTPGEGIVCMGMDTVHGRMYGITWPGMLFLYYDIPTGKIKNFGKKVETPGITDLTAVPGNRAIAVDPNTGNVWWHNMDETISRYTRDTDSVELLKTPTLDIPILKIQSSGGGFNKELWRAIRWSPAMQKFYGVDTNCEYLFSLDPKTGTIEIIDRIAAGPNRKSGNRGSANLAFELSPDGKRVYYITSARSEKPDAGRRSEMRLVSYDLALRQYIDHGPIILDDGRRPSSCSGLDVGRDGNLYLVCIIPLSDLSSDHAKKIVAAHFPVMGKDNQKGAPYEVNLVVVKDPLK
jgi:hypothetical protein